MKSSCGATAPRTAQVESEVVAVVTLDDILRIHDGWIERLGGAHGIWNRDVLLYAFEAQRSPYYEGIFVKAANFGGRITKEHAFNDGNKRTGFSCMKFFLNLNRWELRRTFSEAYEVMKRLALGTGIEGEMTYDELAQWLEANSIAV